VCAERLRRLARDVRGGGAIEFAMCAPIFLMLVVGVVQFGWTQHTFSTIRFALQQASRALVIDPNTSEATLQSMVDARLARGTNAQVDVSLVRNVTPNGTIATLNGAYVATFGVPGLASFRLPYQVTVSTLLRTGP
jgi:Flp pilus assembly protein TadG